MKSIIMLTSTMVFTISMTKRKKKDSSKIMNKITKVNKNRRMTLKRIKIKWIWTQKSKKFYSN